MSKVGGPSPQVAQRPTTATSTTTASPTTSAADAAGDVTSTPSSTPLAAPTEDAATDVGDAPSSPRAGVDPEGAQARFAARGQYLAYAIHQKVGGGATTQNAGASAGASTDPEVARHLKDAKGTDPAKRKSALAALNTQAAAGNRAALDALGELVAGTLYDAPYDAQDGIRRSAMRGLEGAKRHLGASDYDAIAKGLESYEIEDRAAALLGAEVKAGNEAAIGALRRASTGGVMANREAAELLAEKLPASKRTAGDYEAFAAGDGLDGRSARHRALADGVRRGDDGAVAAVRAVLHQKDSVGLSTEQQEAMKIFARHPSRLDAADVAKLHEHATPGEYNFGRETAVETLGAAAKAGRPGALDAFVDVARKVPRQSGDRSISSGDDHVALRYSTTKTAQDVFEHTSSAAVRARVAPFALEDAGDTLGPKVVDALKPRALRGDKEAIEALAGATSQRGRTTPAAAGAALEEAARAGHAAKVVDALQAEYERTGTRDDGETLATLGRASAHLPASDPRRSASKETLRDALSGETGARHDDSVDSAGRGMTALGGKLSDDDIGALLQSRSPEAARALVRGAPEMSDAQRRHVLDAARGDLSRDWAQETMKGMAKHLSADDVAALETRLSPKWSKPTADAVRRERPIGDALAGVLEQHPDASVRRKAANALLSRNVTTAGPKAQEALTNHAAASGDVALRKKVLAHLPSSPITEQHLESVAKAYGRGVGDAIKRAPEGSQMHTLGKLLRARQMKDHEDYGGNVDVAAVDRKIGELTSSEPLKGELETIRRSAIRVSMPHDAGAKQEAYLKSDAFQQRMRLLGPQEQSALVEGELAKLHGVAPERVQSTADHLRGRMVQEHTVRTFQELGDKPKQVSAVELALKGVGDAAKLGSNTRTIAENITTAMGKLDRDTPAGQMGAKLLDKLEQMQRDATGAEASRLASTVEYVREANRTGKLPALLTGASLIGMASKGMPKDAFEATQATSTIMSAVGSADDIGQLFRVSDATKLGKAFKVMKWLGPAGDALGAVADGWGAYRDFKAGDTVGGVAKSVGAASGLVGAGAGVAILAGASGPAAPLVLVGAAAVGLISWGVDALFGKSEEQEFLEGLGVWKD